MGIPFIAVNMPKNFCFKFLVGFLTFIKLVFLLTLSNLRISRPPRLLYTSDQDQDSTEGYVLLIDELCSSPIPVPVSTLARLIKNKLQAITYSSLLERTGKLEDDQENVCSVCLDCIHGRDEVRKLCNCSHVFHLKCLDSWVDQAHVTCPTCRSMLFPEKMGGAAMYLLAFQDSLVDEQGS
ncbi:RING ZINC FINGER PROTEIN-RELATED [Salix koriyanagi]|uniref:RING ZINC FINGER PROTEIN-RELATED n=1 Tax=Salix koriyanagi TaxID=2511006 RepID=A0A9Q1AML1_9ROSI|nr:RING ZINC FINGER PROTEIN-RELATED [Salix koriyanagi]